MLAGSARTGTSICVSIVRDPALVRTVRLVAAAVARRASGDEDLVEEVRLAVGEACALLVGIGDEPETRLEPSAVQGTTEHWVEVALSWSDRLRVTVRSPGPPAAPHPATADVDGVDPWILLRGLIADVEVVRKGEGTAVSMSWPLDRVR